MPFAFVAVIISPNVLPTSLIPTPTNTPTRTPIQSGQANTPTPTPTMTPTPTPTSTPTPTPSPKPTSSPTPSPSPTPTVIPVSGTQLDEWFTKYANHYSIDRSKLWNVAVCESGLRANAINGPYGGMFQFSSSTWVSTRREMGMDTNPSLRFDAQESIRTAAFKMSTVGLSPWPSCGK
jgi:hypothetical protein